MSTTRAEQPWHQTLKWEQGLFLMALLLGGILRFIGLDLHPLSDTEARLALQAYALAQGQPVPDLAGQPGYLIPTAVAFFLFGAREATARFWPALGGLLVIVLPWLLRNRLGRRMAVFLSLGLALDAGLVATSRLAAGDSLAVLGLLGFMTFLWRGEWRLAGVALALGILGGPSFWIGALILLLTWCLWRWVDGVVQDALAFGHQGHEVGQLVSWKAVGISCLVTLVAVGSGLGALGR
jgi:4-amino-4-deoxy-L-arabinose transferase-like glycosyltransferase